MSLDTFTDAAGLSYRQYARTGKLMILRGSQNQSNANSYIVAHVIDKDGKEEFGTAFGPMSSPEALSRFQTELLKLRTAEPTP